ncbi:MAG: GAP family protein [Mycobacteriaceae bacterium]|nr:GAP family protein [Mycobacteriaceae bacterium]
MWGYVLVLAFFAAVDLMRLGVTVLLISRPRPIATLLAYWAGCLVASLPAILVPLAILHLVPTLRTFTENLAGTVTTAIASSAGRHVQVGMGVVALAIAAFMAARHKARAQVSLPLADTNPGTSSNNAGNPIFWLLGRGQDTTSDSGSALRRLLGRARDAWENGSVWMSFVVGIYSGPPPFELLFLVTAIVASGAAIGTQITAAVVFTIGMLAIVEIILLSYLAIPTRTEAVMQRLHCWVRDHRRPVIVASFALMGVCWVAAGI